MRCAPAQVGHGLGCLAVLSMILLGAGGCGGRDVDLDGSVADVPGDDAAVDAPVDPAPDVGPDPVHDAPPDPAGDPPADVPGEDLPAEVPADPPEDWPHDTSTACAAAGGFCSGARWMLCPAGYEPVGLDHLGCEIEGWCCVLAPSSTCTDSGTANCVPGTACEGCWGDAGGGLECEAGRVCCVDVCW